MHKIHLHNSSKNIIYGNCKLILGVISIPYLLLFTVCLSIILMTLFVWLFYPLCTVSCTHFNCSFLSPLVYFPLSFVYATCMFISSSFIHHKSKLTSLLLTHTHLIVCFFYQVFIFRTLDSCLTAYYTYQTWRCTRNG